MLIHSVIVVAFVLCHLFMCS